MPRYRIIVEAQATISETWMVDAASKKEAEERFDNQQAEFLEDSVVGDERDRIIVSVEEE